MTLHTASRALMGTVRAETDPARILADINTAVTDMRANSDARLSVIEAALDQQISSGAMAALGVPLGSGAVAVDPEYSKTFASFVRRGDDDGVGADLRKANSQGARATIHAALSVGDNSNGGYLAPTEWDRQVHQAQRAESPMRRLATVMQSGVAGYSTLWHDRNWGSGWVGETAARPATTSGTLEPINFAAGEVYANVAVTQQLLDDAQLDITAWLTGQIGSEFARQEDIAFLSGDGVNKPRGLLTYAAGGSAAAIHPGGALDTVPSGAAAAVTGDGLIDFAYGLASPYRANASWLMSSQTVAHISKLKDGQGNYLWREAIASDQPPTLLGRPVEFDEGMPPVAAGNLAVAYGDFRAGYLINDRIGTRILRDPFTNKPFVMFYATKRVGAGLLDPRAIRVMQIAAG